VCPDVVKKRDVNAPSGPGILLARVIAVNAGTVEKGQIVGKAGKRWFLRRQAVL
jgi:hypothetical protein